MSITGGKLMTYRLMGEQATDVVCRKLGIDRKCETAVLPLPGSEGGKVEEVSRKIWGAATTPQKASVGRAGTRAELIPLKTAEEQALVCECEEVSVGEVNNAIEHLEINNMVDLRRRTRVGMGTCQGELCACRAAGLLGKAKQCTEKAKQDLRSFMNERWKGMYPIAWGDALREAEYTQWVYNQVLGLNEE